MGASSNEPEQEYQKHLMKSDFNKYKKELIDKIEEIIEEAFNDFKKETKERKNATKGKIIEKLKKYLIDFELVLSKNKIPKTNNKGKEEIVEPFDSYDIECEYSKLTSEIKNESRNYEDEDEEPENKRVSFFCRNIGIISREAYNQSNLILKIFHERYKNEEKIKLKCEEDLIRNNFSCWIKLKEKYESNIYTKYLNNCVHLFKNKDLICNEEEKKYLIKIYKKLTILYIHCRLSFPIINIYFNLDEAYKNNDFLHKDMIDFINKGINRKVNFIFLPCLKSNGVYLKNGLFYVFTYKNENNKTFYFEKINLDCLLTVEEFNIEKCIVLKPKVKDNKVFVTIDYNFDDNLNLEYFFEFKDIKNKNKEAQQRTKTNYCEIPYGCIFEKCELLYKNKTIGKSIKYEKINK